ncbi:MAG: ParB/RepB/Spo0J family partition protein [Methylobacter sp.]
MNTSVKIEKLKIHHVEIDSIKPNDFNPNVVTAENRKKIEESVSRLGIFKPILCRQHNGALEIIGGEHRWEAAKRLGYKEVPIIDYGEISDSRAKEIGVVDNARYGADDSLKLSELLNSLDDVDILSGILPYSDIEIETLMSAVKVDLDSLVELDDDLDNDFEELPTPVKTHTIMRFKLPLEDAERLQGLIQDAIKINGFTDSDALTNAGDALVHLLLNTGE